jgi:hypothetical protein
MTTPSKVAKYTTIAVAAILFAIIVDIIINIPK